MPEPFSEPGAHIQPALSAISPSCLSSSCICSCEELSTCRAHRFHTAAVHCLCSTSLFPGRLTSLLWTATHYIVLCRVSAPLSVVYIFIIQCTASGLVYYTSNPLLNRESFTSSCAYLLLSSPGEVSLRNITEVADSRGAL